MKFLLTAFFATVLLTLVSCSPITLNQAKKSGEQLNARSIFDLVSGNTFTLSAYDFDGTIYFSEKGRVSGKDNEGQTDTGSWDIKNNDQLCIRFKIWYYGGINCYSLVNDVERNLILFYTSNGASYYSGSLQKGDSENLASLIKTSEQSSPKYLRKTFTAEQQTSSTAGETEKKPTSLPASASPSSDMDTTSSVRQLAKNCNGCNLSGANLKEAMLVKAKLEGANLSKADLRYANLRRARLSGADLSGAKLNHANLPGADLRNCNLRGADLSGANLLLTDFTGADLTGAIMNNTHIENTIGIE